MDYLFTVYAILLPVMGFIIVMKHEFYGASLWSKNWASIQPVLHLWATTFYISFFSDHNFLDLDRPDIRLGYLLIMPTLVASLLGILYLIIEGNFDNQKFSFLGKIICWLMFGPTDLFKVNKKYFMHSTYLTSISLIPLIYYSWFTLVLTMILIIIGYFKIEQNFNQKINLPTSEE